MLCSGRSAGCPRRGGLSLSGVGLGVQVPPQRFAHYWLGVRQEDKQSLADSGSTGKRRSARVVLKDEAVFQAILGLQGAGHLMVAFFPATVVNENLRQDGCSARLPTTTRLDPKGTSKRRCQLVPLRLSCRSVSHIGVSLATLQIRLAPATCRGGPGRRNRAAS